MIGALYKCNEPIQNHTTQPINIESPIMESTNQTIKPKKWKAFLTCFVSMKLIKLISFFQTGNVEQSLIRHIFKHSDHYRVPSNLTIGMREFPFPLAGLASTVPPQYAFPRRIY